MLSPNLQGWIERTQRLWQRMKFPSINHIFRENNTQEDRLSKKGLLASFGSMKIIPLVKNDEIND